MPPPDDPLRLQPIGFLRTDRRKKFQLPAQPEIPCQAVVELLRGHNFEAALRDLEGFSRIWLLWWFDRHENWRPTTLPPRGRGPRRGTFATRSPYRPNPLGMSCVPLLGVEGLTLYIGAHDLLADTPVLDIKPYIPKFDAFPAEQTGWFGQMECELASQPPHRVVFGPAAESRLRAEPELRAHIEELLSADPYPHRTRRIIRYGDRYRLARGDWRIYYAIEEDVVVVEEVRSREESSPEH